MCDYPIEQLGRWARWPGHWGSSERAIFGEGKGPPGPANQGQKWNDPAAWHRRLKVQRFRYFLGLLVWLLGRLTYPRTPQITYADADGKTIEAPGLTTNQKVRVHYTKVGGDNVADKVTLIGN